MRVVVVGAGIVGSCTALALTRAGCEVTVIDRGPVGSGTTSRGEGNVLVSDKAPGPELDLALVSSRRWAELADEVGDDALEYERKGGVVTSADPALLPELRRLAASQRDTGVDAEVIDDPHSLEPDLAPEIGQGIWYPQDAQVQPVLAAHALLAEARRRGARFVSGHEVTSGLHRGGRLAGVRTDQGLFEADAVVNASGTWGGEVGRRLGGEVPVLPRRGFILVTEPTTPFIRHKVYSADYVANVAASTEGLETSVVVESTRGGTVLIGASRERVGYDMTMAPSTVATLARQAVTLFPRLAGLQLMRVYRGFRPYCPDHLPVIGPDPRVPGLVHACGHEGAGIGLAPATGDLVAAHLTGGDVDAAAGGSARALLPDRLIEEPDEEKP
ncbi:MAG: FAD-binding oxidoreductase [Dermatophilus congolensis]|nr:FAD-binding oxidoreductase [Dermatophilus congolensis]